MIMEVVKQESTNVVLIGIKLAIARYFLSQDRYNLYLAKQLTKIDKEALPYYAGGIIQCLKLSRKISLQYADTDKETITIVKMHPVFKNYYKDVYTAVKTYRKKYGLK